MGSSQPITSPDVTAPPEHLRSTLESIARRVQTRPPPPPPAPDPPSPRFAGFRRLKSNFTPVPDELFDSELGNLSGPELKVLLYIMRRTLGWKRDFEALSLSQIVHGLQGKNPRPRAQTTTKQRGVILTKSTVAKALASLEGAGYIARQRRQTVERGNEPTVYSLRELGDP